MKDDIEAAERSRYRACYELALRIIENQRRAQGTSPTGPPTIDPDRLRLDVQAQLEPAAVDHRLNMEGLIADAVADVIHGDKPRR